MATVTDALKNPSTRWKFVFVSFLIVIVLFLIRFTALPIQLQPDSTAFENVTARILEALATALLAAVLIQALALWFGRDETSASLINILDRTTETTPEFKAAFSTAKGHWYFKGGFGSYFRTDTLPALLKDGATGLDVMIVLIDIRDSELVEKYAEYRRQASNDEKIDGEKVRTEICQTILALANSVAKRGGAFSQARVALINTYSPFRLDFHDHGAILTHDSKTSPALKFSPDSSYYFGFKQELEQFKPNAIDLKTLPKGDLADVSKILAHFKK